MICKILIYRNLGTRVARPSETNQTGRGKKCMFSIQIMKLSLALVVILVAISGYAENQTTTNNYQYAVPEKTNDGWKTASLKDTHLDANLIKELFERIGDNSYKNIHSVLLVKNGKLIVEEYFPGQDSIGQYRMFTRDTLNEMHSATKSVNSILIGIAIDQHLIRGVDEKISTFFPEYSDVLTNKEKDAIRLKDLLSMTAGLSWDEWTYPYTDPRNDAAMMASKADFFRYVLERPVATSPGTKFTYSSGVSLMLGEIIYKASGLKADKFAERYLFSPLGITNFSWGESSQWRC